MGALSDLWKSERGLVGFAIIAAATVLFALGRLSSEQWTSIVQWTFASYVAGKSITGAIALHATAKGKQQSELNQTLGGAIGMYMASMSGAHAAAERSAPPTMATAGTEDEFRDAVNAQKVA